MAFRRRVGECVDPDANWGVVESESASNMLGADEVAWLEGRMTAIHSELELPGVSDFRTQGQSCFFRIPKDDRNRAVVRRHGGRIISTDNMGCNVEVPFPISRLRKIGIVLNTRFGIVVAGLLMCFLWIAWQYLTRDDLLGSFVKSWRILTDN